MLRRAPLICLPILNPLTCGAEPRKQFLAQFFGVFFGAIAIVAAWLLMFPDVATLEAYEASATNMWKAIALALTSGLSTIPSTAHWAISIGRAMGIALLLIVFFAPRARVICHLRWA